jgi:hypothetical protein
MAPLDDSAIDIGQQFKRCTHSLAYQTEHRLWVGTAIEQLVAVLPKFNEALGRQTGSEILSGRQSAEPPGQPATCPGDSLPELVEIRTQQRLQFLCVSPSPFIALTLLEGRRTRHTLEIS